MKKIVKLTESDLHRIVKESVIRILNEMSLHKGHSVYAHNNDQWAPEGDEWKWGYDGDRVDRYLWRMKKDAQNDDCCGPKGFPMASWFARNAKDYFRYIGEYSGDLPHLPFVGDVSKPEDDYEMSPEDLYRAIDELCYGDSCGYDNYRAFN